MPHEYKPLKVIAEAVNEYFDAKSGSYIEDRKAANKQHGVTSHKKKRTKKPKGSDTKREGGSIELVNLAKEESKLPLDDCKIAK